MAWRGIGVGLAVLLVVSNGRACSIPVFRYALENWSLTPYDVVIFHRGGLSPKERALADKLEAAQETTNLKLHRIDVDAQISPRWRKAWDRFGREQKLPCLMVLPAAAEKDAPPPRWSGKFTADAVEKLLDSPVRRSLVERLGRGDSGVFLVLKSGDAGADKEVVAFVRAGLEALEKKINLPELTPDGPQLRYALPLQLRFSILEIDADEPEEQVFLHMLRANDELADVKGPIVVAIFGRGRMLCSLHGPTLNEGILATVGTFLCGPCSCRFKEENPGVDLLISARWTELLEKSGKREAEVQIAAATETTTTTSMPPSIERPPPVSSTETMPAPAPAASPPCGCIIQEFVHTATPRQWLWLGTGVAGVLVVVTGIWAFRSRRLPPDPGA